MTGYINTFNYYYRLAMSASSDRTFSVEVFLSDDGCGFSGKIKQL